MAFSDMMNGASPPAVTAPVPAQNGDGLGRSLFIPATQREDGIPTAGARDEAVATPPSLNDDRSAEPAVGRWPGLVRAAIIVGGAVGGWVGVAALMGWL